VNELVEAAELVDTNMSKSAFGTIADSYEFRRLRSAVEAVKAEEKPQDTDPKPYTLPHVPHGFVNFRGPEKCLVPGCGQPASAPIHIQKFEYPEAKR
jgi:hypothetical protein